MQDEDWFYRLTGLASDDFASVQQGIVLEAGNHLYSLANQRRLQAGYLSLPALARLVLEATYELTLLIVA